MKQFMMLCVCIAIAATSVGCCWMHPYGGGYGGGCAGGACGGGGGGYGAPSYYGGGGYPAGAYYGGTSMSAGLPVATPYAFAPTYTTTAGLPVNSLPTY